MSPPAPEDSRLEWAFMSPGQVPKGAVKADEWEGHVYYVGREAERKEEDGEASICYVHTWMRAYHNDF